MRPAPLPCVLDASTAIKYFVNEPLTVQADALFMRWEEAPDAWIAVPDLFYAECGNVLWKHVRKGICDPAGARRILRTLTELDFQRIPMSELVGPALELATETEATVYDCCYVAASVTLKLPVITADRRLVRRFANRDEDVRWLGDLAISGDTE